MPKKKRKSKSRKKPSKKRKVIKRKSKSRKKPSKKRKVIKRKSKSRKKSSKKRKVIKKNSIGKQYEKSSSSDLVFKTKQEWLKNGLVNKSQYQNKYNESIKNNNAFWKKEGKRINWIKPFKKIKDRILLIKNAEPVSSAILENLEFFLCCKLCNPIQPKNTDNNAPVFLEGVDFSFARFLSLSIFHFS